MIYISKGRGKLNFKRELTVTRCGKIIKLSGIRAELWQRGRCGFVTIKTQAEEMALNDLSRLGLVETEQEATWTAQYRIMTYCVPCPVWAFPWFGLSPDERTTLRWLTKAGLRMTIAELIYLKEHEILPTRDLLRPRNRQALVEKIYTPMNISDNLLEQQMEKAECRDQVVTAILGLLKKKRLVLI